MEVIIGNIIEINHLYISSWWMLLLLAAAAAVILTAIESFLPPLYFTILNLLSFSAGMCFYIQMLMLNGKLSTMTGGVKKFDTVTVILNLLIWAAVFAAVFAAYFILKKNEKSQLCQQGIVFISLAVTVMQLVGIVSLAAGTDFSSSSLSTYCLSTEKAYELSAENNVLFFVLDTCDNRYVDTALERYPDMLDGMNGFTYYHNSISTYSKTYPSVPVPGIESRQYREFSPNEVGRCVP